MHVTQANDRIRIDCSIGEYAQLIALLVDLLDHQDPILPDFLRAVLCAHQNFTRACDSQARGATDEPPVILTGPGGSYARAWPHLSNRRNTAEQIGARPDDLAAISAEAMPLPG